MEIPGYKIEREIGQGGMSTVYLATQESLQRQVAIKVIKPSLIIDEDFTKRFLREGRLVAQLNDPRIITVFDIGVHKDIYYLSMEYLSGGSLSERIRKGLSLDEAIKVARAIAGALGYAHKRGIVHRDIKPQNIMFHENGNPVLTDFGIAKAIGGTTMMTMSGVSLGTPRYMSPEQIKGQPVDSRSDLYSFGVLFYEMLTGQLPYSADESFALAFKHVTEPIPDLPPRLAIFQPLLNRLLAKDPNDRFATAEAFMEALNTLERELSPTVIKKVVGYSPVSVKSEKPSAFPWKLGTIAAAIFAVAGGGLYYFFLHPAEEKPAVVVSSEDAARQKAEEERRRQEATAAQAKAEAEAKALAEREAQQKAEEERRRQEAAAAQAKAEVEAKALAEREAQQKAEEERRRQEAAAAQTEVETAADAKVAALLKKCAAYLQSGRLNSGRGGNAVDCYRSVLKQDRGNTEAQAGLDRVADKLSVLLTEALRRGDQTKAKGFLKQIEQIDPQYRRLVDLRRQVQDAEQEARAKAEAEAKAREEAAAKAREEAAAKAQAAAEAKAQAEAKARAEMEAKAEATWNKLKDSQNAADIENFLATYGDIPKYSVAARLKLEQLQSRQQQPVPEEQQAGLSVSANVAGAKVWINDKDYGSTQLNVDLEPGTYRVRVEKDGYKGWEQEVRLTANKKRSLLASLEPLGEQPAANNSKGASKGCVQGNCSNGKGTYAYDNGDQYTGEWRGTQRNGNGTFIYADKGEKYDGEWRNGIINGQGTYYYQNGEKYVGQFRNGQMYGKGSYYYNSGNTYEGEWKNGRKDGKGIYNYADKGEKYVGDFKNDRPNGQGAYYYNNGDKYVGEWKNGRKDGEGLFYASSGEKFAEVWENDRKIKVVPQ